MKTRTHATRMATVAVAFCLIALPAAALVTLPAGQTYDFYISESETGWVAEYNFDTDTLAWHGPASGPGDFPVTFSRPPYNWIGLFSYSANRGEYDRAYYLYYTVI